MLLSVPLVAPSLAKQCGERVLASVCEECNAFLSDHGELAPWNVVGTSLKSWLRAVSGKEAASPVPSQGRQS